MAIQDIEHEQTTASQAQPIFELEDELVVTEPVEFELAQANDEPLQEFELEEPELVIETVSPNTESEAPETVAQKDDTENTDIAIVEAEIKRSHVQQEPERKQNAQGAPQAEALPTVALPNDSPPVSTETPHTEVIHDLEALKQIQLHQRELILVNKVDELVDALKKRTERNKTPEQSAGKQFSTGIHYIKYEDNHYLGAKWFRKAGLQGHARAQLYLGLMFIKGEGVPKSLFHAFAWLSLANCQKLPEAENALKQLANHLTAKQKNAALKHAADLLEQIHTL